jgi:hypothetical protein
MFLSIWWLQVEAELDKDKFNPAILNVGPDEIVPEVCENSIWIAVQYLYTPLACAGPACLTYTSERLGLHPKVPQDAQSRLAEAGLRAQDALRSTFI